MPCQISITVNLWYAQVTASDRYRMAKTAQRASGAKRVERGRDGAAKSTALDKDIGLEKDTKTKPINPDDLVAHLHEVESTAQDDIFETSNCCSCKTMF